MTNELQTDDKLRLCVQHMNSQLTDSYRQDNNKNGSRAKIKKKKKKKRQNCL